MMHVDVRLNLEGVKRSLNEIVNKQVPFAAAQAITELAKEVGVAETANIEKTFKNPSPFTIKSVAVQPARKTNLTARVYVRPLAAKYLDPYETGGVHKLNSRALLNPKDLPLNAYGQLSRGALARLRGRPDIFIGPVKTKKGIVNGVWQRSVPIGSAVLSQKGRKLRNINTSGQLKLLLRFGDALPVKQRLHFGDTASALVGKRFNAVFGKCLAKALATAK